MIDLAIAKQIWPQAHCAWYEVNQEVHCVVSTAHIELLSCSLELLVDVQVAMVDMYRPLPEGLC